MFDCIKFTITFFLVMVVADAGTELLIAILSTKTESVFVYMTDYIRNEMHWASKIVGALVFGIAYYYFLRPDLKRKPAK